MADPMTTDTAALVARLRELAARLHNEAELEQSMGFASDHKITSARVATVSEAADRLESLSAPAPDGEVSAVEFALLRIMPEFGPPDEFGHYNLDHGNIALLVSRAIAALPRRDGMEALEAERDRAVELINTLDGWITFAIRDDLNLRANEPMPEMAMQMKTSAGVRCFMARSEILEYRAALKGEA